MVGQFILKLGFRFLLGVYVGYKLFKAKERFEQGFRGYQNNYQENDENYCNHSSHNSRDTNETSASTLKKGDKSNDPEAQPIKPTDKLINIGGECFEVNKFIAELTKASNPVQTPHESQEESLKTKQHLSSKDSSSKITQIMSLIQEHSETVNSSTKRLQQKSKLIVSLPSSTSSEEEESEKLDEEDEEDEEDEDESDDTSQSSRLGGFGCIRLSPLLNSFPQRRCDSDSSECSYSS